ncbi:MULTISPECIES: peptidoglycan-binding domain-containing protein [unclassified Crossiella]|uniref:peptidoglycan-binding protein n=1 Tax=unclassified Crossiella TaxID=2620835 RepID=UPI001FFEAD47|nr:MULTISPECIES: peptidoglycan-binding domain-containing protein [unclassified Crossiella]MCK2239648.1 peptidoglycan-binding protein [Crossiella sp. S99.2]MCK2252343.1 peptidoglycan-binding protein [Crossiella sp. S99.1]
MPRGETRRWFPVTAVAVSLVAAGGIAWFVLSPQGTPAAQPSGPPVRTVKVQRTELSTSQNFPGALGFGADQVVKGAGAGLVTRLPKGGDGTERGKPLFWVNDQPVPVFYGATPLFRKLEAPATGDPLRGNDVTVIAENLRALGYSIGTQPKTSSRPGESGTPAVFTPALSTAVKKWQQKAGLPATGTVDIGQLLVLPGPSRVGTVTAQLGDPATGPLLKVTGTTKAVSMEIAATEADKVKQGAEVVIQRPDTKEVPAVIRQVGTVVQGGGESGGQNSQPKITVTAMPKDPAALSDLDAASVQVRVVAEARPNVLAVPVGALLALREGGYAVQLPGGELKPVQTGLFAKELVEISGPGIAEGQAVVTVS